MAGLPEEAVHQQAAGAAEEYPSRSTSKACPAGEEEHRSLEHQGRPYQGDRMGNLHIHSRAVHQGAEAAPAAAKGQYQEHHIHHQGHHIHSPLRGFERPMGASLPGPGNHSRRGGGCLGPSVARERRHWEEDHAVAMASCRDHRNLGRDRLQYGEAPLHREHLQTVRA